VPLAFRGIIPHNLFTDLVCGIVATDAALLADTTFGNKMHGLYIQSLPDWPRQCLSRLLFLTVRAFVLRHVFRSLYRYQVLPFTPALELESGFHSFVPILNVTNPTMIKVVPIHCIELNLLAASKYINVNMNEKKMMISYNNASKTKFLENLATKGHKPKALSKYSQITHFQVPDSSPFAHFVSTADVA
jgi:hypothetical protein